MPNYPFNTQNHVRIWFSPKKDVFLNPENQLRMVRFRQQNPTAKMTLIYSSRMLNNFAQANLQHFCIKYDFNPLDFDTELFQELIDQLDSNLYQFAKSELDAFIAERGGNLGAASDLTRLITAVLVKGTYSDFDTNIKVNMLPEIVYIEAPIVLDIGSIVTSFEPPAFNNDIIGSIVTSFELPAFNNDIIGVSIQNNQLAPAAKNYIQRIQKEIITAYRDGAERTLECLSKSPCGAENSLVTFYRHGYFDNLFKVYPNPGITDFRWLLESSTKNIFSSLRIMQPRYFNDLKNELASPLRQKLLKALSGDNNFDFPAFLKTNEIQRIKQLYLLYSQNILHVHVLSQRSFSSSQANELDALYDSIKSLDDPEECFRILNSHRQSLKIISIADSVTHFSGPFVIRRSLFEGANRLSYKELSFDYNNLFQNFNSDQSIQLGTSEQDYNQNLQSSDGSWLSEGQKLTAQREALMNGSAKTIQRAWKFHLDFIKNERLQDNHYPHKNSPKKI